jgi:hypothetical protein
VLYLLAAAGVAGGVVVLATVPPGDATFYPRCQLHSLTGLHCPGCGTTRALHALLNGRVTQALAYNGLTFILFPVVGWNVARAWWFWSRGRTVPGGGRSTEVWVWLLVALMVVYGVLRNIPRHPFNLLAPHEL